MELAYVVRRSFPGPGGIATHMRVIAKELSARHHVRVWASRIDDAPFDRLNTTLGLQSFHPCWVDGIEIRPVPMGLGALAASTPMALMTVPGLRRFGFKALRHATAPGFVRSVGARLAADWGAPDVVHCWGGEHVNWAAGHAARAAGIPLVVTPFAHPGAWGDDPLNAAFYRSAQIVLALLPAEAEMYTKLGVDPARLRVVGVPVTPLPETGPDVRARYQLGDDPIVLFLGVKEPYKGYRALIEAAPRVWAESPTTRFAFVGPRTAASQTDFAAIDDPRILEAGRVSSEEVSSWLRAATVFCLPSTSEILPGSVLEAWQAATPVVVAEWWCARDLVTHERDGLVVPPDAPSIAAALTTLLKDPRAAAAMGRNGRATAQRYAPPAVAQRHEGALAAARNG